ncbi:MAG TPA: FGGY family carbohydrate kinase [Actinotalea sp.]|nr:FGGY family carbohydrate kinase [Actinotalea sp.]
MPRPLVLALDEGTTNTKALLVDASSGAVVAVGSRPVGIAFPAPGSVEQDAAELWSATRGAIDDCLAQVPGAVPVAVSVSNQRESVVAWSRATGAPLGPVLGWQDARTADACAALGAEAAAVVRARTGLTLDPMFSAPKMRWLLDAALAAGADPADVCLGTVDAWLVRNLTGEHATEAGNASRTLLLDLRTLDWHPELLAIFGIPVGALPEVRASNAGFGATVDLGRLPAGVPVVAVLADSHSALYHHGCTRPGAGKATFGTGSSIMTPCVAPDEAPQGIATTVAWLTDAPTYAREGNIVASGSALDWMAATLGGSGGAFLTALAGEVPDAGGVSFVPAFSGLGAPYWDRAATGVVVGVTGGTTRAHLARAALEAVAHQVADVVEAIELDGAARIDVLHADGGATASPLLMQLQADLLGREVLVADAPEASALGAALLAARTVGLAPPEAPDPTGRPPVRPSIDAVERSARRRAWARAISRSRGHAVSDAPP